MSESKLLQPGLNIKPEMNLENGKILAETLYGFTCDSITELNSYDDKNYKITITRLGNNSSLKVIHPSGYVLKILNSLDSKKVAFIEAQNSLLLFLGRKGISCPQPSPNVNGEYYQTVKLKSGEHAVRLLEYIPGDILYQVPASGHLCYDVGRYVAKLDVAMQKFHHPAYDTHKSLWMLESVPQLKQFLFAIKNINEREIVERIIEEFQERVLTVKENLEGGIIHGDFNEHNVVVENVGGEWRVKSILDFGDSQISCYLFELAIAMAYMMVHGKELEVGGFVIAGYSSIRPVPQEEFALLKICIAARLCQSFVMGAYSSSQDPENGYLVSNSKMVRELMLKLWAEPENQLINKWKDIAKSFK